MTALDQYQRLEAVALWRPTPDADPREVIVSFGNATLTLMNMDEQPWAHWSLAAVQEIGSDAGGLVLTPDPDQAETLTLNDPDMIEAIRAISTGTSQQPDAVRRIRLLMPILLTIAVLIGIGLMARHPITAYLSHQIDDVTWERAGIALTTELMLPDNARLCRINSPGALRTTRGHPLLAQISARLTTGGTTIRPTIARFEGAPVLFLPGSLVLINADVIDRADQPEQIAGLLALAQARHNLNLNRDVITQTLGLMGTIRLAFSGAIPQAYYDEILTALEQSAQHDGQADSAALRLLTTAQLPSLPVSLLLNEYGVPRLRIEALQAGDSIGPAIYTPALDDADWLRLQATCP